MSPAPKYRARRCNTATETKGVGGGQRGANAVLLFSNFEKRMESTGLGIETDGFPCLEIGIDEVSVEYDFDVRG
jgi:hypothetical protein